MVPVIVHDPLQLVTRSTMQMFRRKPLGGTVLLLSVTYYVIFLGTNVTSGILVHYIGHIKCLCSLARRFHGITR